MSTGTNPPMGGKPNLRLMVPDELTGEPSPPETVPDKCCLQSDAVQAAGANVSTALEILRQRLETLRECRLANGATNSGFEANGSEVSDPLEYLAMAQQLIDAAVKMAKS